MSWLFIDENETRALGIIDTNTNELDRPAGLNTGRLGAITEIDAYEVDDGDDRIYAVRTEAKQVIQMRGSTEGYNLPDLRLEGNGLNNLLDVEVNEGRIFVVSAGEGLRRFYGQEELGNVVKGMINGDNWNKVSALAIDDRYIYLADSTNSRILVYLKYRQEDSATMDFVAQYDLSSLAENGDIQDIASSREQGGLFVLIGSKVIKLDLAALREFSY